MAKQKVLIAACFFLISGQALALFELDGDFSYSKQVYGAQRQNDQVSRTYSGAFAVYMFKYTAIEFSYSHTDDITSENDEVKVEGTNSSLIASQNRVQTRVGGVGIRQALSSRKARIRPMISLGYARVLTNDQTDFTFRDDGTGAEVIVQDDLVKTRQDSAFGTFAIQIKLTKLLSIKLSVKTIIPGFDFDKASDNMKYAAGFSWFF